uniref:Uncharacterized protein n=1 Tax=Aegilops tauschii subsp. strangulata TaxID=200361 RepID=A0A452XK04_AEGTS
MFTSYILNFVKFQWMYNKTFLENLEQVPKKAPLKCNFRACAVVDKTMLS